MVDVQRLDKWLWFSRFFKSRTLASKACHSSKVRVNGQIANKASATVKVDDVLTFPRGHHVRVVKILGLGQRRGPAAEASFLYDDLSPQLSSDKLSLDGPLVAGQRDLGSGRPTKRERRAVDRLQDR